MVAAIANELVDVTAKIGHGGKLHPAKAKAVVKNPGTRRESTQFQVVRFCCRCTGTNSGAAMLKATVVGTGDFHDCKS